MLLVCVATEVATRVATGPFALLLVALLLVALLLVTLLLVCFGRGVSPLALPDFFSWWVYATGIHKTPGGVSLNFPMHTRRYTGLALRLQLFAAKFAIPGRGVAVPRLVCGRVQTTNCK